jgi:hypothetical protein
MCFPPAPPNAAQFQDIDFEEEDRSWRDFSAATKFNEQDRQSYI